MQRFNFPEMDKQYIMVSDIKICFSFETALSYNYFGGNICYVSQYSRSLFIVTGNEF